MLIPHATYLLPNTLQQQRFHSRWLARRHCQLLLSKSSILDPRSHSFGGIAFRCCTFLIELGGEGSHPCEDGHKRSVDRPLPASQLTAPGLLPLLKSIHKHCTLKKFAGQTIGVDAYGWLHRGVVGCACALALDKPTSIHLDFVLSRVRMLLDFGVTPYLVFDGDNIPSKAGTNAARRKKREESKALALELQRAGKSSQAQQEFQKAVDVTPLMARQLIEELKKLNVQYIVAPYEADAQLVYLEQNGIIDGILSEDSDLLVFGAKRLLTKLNQYGELVEVERADFAMCKEVSLAGWTDAMFMRMAILSGCDYLPNIGKMGLKTAHAYVRKYRETEKILRMVQFEGKMVVPDGYSERFRQAELTFLHHRVFCPIAQKMIFLNDLPAGLLESDMPYLGPYVDPETSVGVACGDLDPFSKRPIALGAVMSGPRPALENRRQSYVAATDLKSKKSIETFFKPQRQPLAELDPNTLTPSPSQRRLLERNRNASWEPRPVSSAPALNRSVTSQPLPSPGLDRSSFLARASTLSTYQAPKRQRLCSNAIDPSPTKEVKQSPFFASERDESSPLAQKRGKIKKNKRGGFEVFSDDSVDGTLSNCEVQQVASPEKYPAAKECLQAESDGASGDQDALQSVPQSSPLMRACFVTPVSSLCHSSASHSSSGTDDRPALGDTREIDQDDDPAAFEDLLDYHVRKQNEALSRKFAFHPEAQREVLRPSPGPAQDKPCQTFSAQSPGVQLAALRKLPKTVDISAFCHEIQLHTTFDQQSPDIQRFALNSLNQSKAGSKTSVSGRTPSVLQTTESSRNSKRSTTLQNGTAGLTSRLAGKGPLRGSEDTIVPDSEDEGSEIDSPRRQPRLDLSSFAFVSA